MCLAKEHNTVTMTRLEPATPLSRIKHPTNEPTQSGVDYGHPVFTIAHIEPIAPDELSKREVHLAPSR